MHAQLMVSYRRSTAYFVIPFLLYFYYGHLVCYAESVHYVLLWFHSPVMNDHPDNPEGTNRRTMGEAT